MQPHILAERLPSSFFFSQISCSCWFQIFFQRRSSRFSWTDKCPRYLEVTRGHPRVASCHLSYLSCAPTAAGPLSRTQVFWWHCPLIVISRLRVWQRPCAARVCSVVWRYLSWPQCFENKTDMTADFRHLANHKDSVIHSGDIQIVELYKCLGTVHFTLTH